MQCVLFWQDGSSILPFVAIFITVALEKKRHFWKSKWLWELWHIGKVSWLLKRLRPACSKVIKVYKLAWWINDEILLLQFPVGRAKVFFQPRLFDLWSCVCFLAFLRNFSLLLHSASVLLMYKVNLVPTRGGFICFTRWHWDFVETLECNCSAIFGSEKEAIL